MKRINLYDDENGCLGSIYCASVDCVVVDIDSMYGIMRVKNPKSIIPEIIVKFIENHATLEIAVELDTVPGETYILRIKDKTMQIMDRFGSVIFKDRCVGALLESEDDDDFEGFRK